MSALPDPEKDAQFYTGVPFKRLIAWLIDFGIILLLTLAAVVGSLGLGAFIYPLIMLCINLAYRIFTLQLFSATLGMRLAGIEIRNAQGNKLNPKEAFWHTGLYTIIFLFIFGMIISVVMMLLSRRGQGLHDYFLGTTAINRPLN